MILKTYQEKAVEELVDYTCIALTSPKRREKILLKAPTGAGKTITVAAYISRLVDEVTKRSNCPRDIAFIWIAPNTLHLQSYDSLKGFYSNLNDIKVVKIDDLSGDVILHSKEMLFLNWSSVDKEKNTFRSENERGYNLDSLVLNTRAENTEIVVIIDEAHLSSLTGVQARKVLELINAKVELSVTATPLEKPDMTVTMLRHKVVSEQMIKKGVVLNPDIKPSEQITDAVDFVLLQQAMKKRDELAQAYADRGIAINPLLLIQLPSENSTLSDEDKNKRNIIEGYLASQYDITTQNGLLAIWMSDSSDKVNLENIESPNAMQKVLIFKQAISQGWDCPRAGVLIIYREYGKYEFGVQTVGRILRMPEQKHYDVDLLNFGYVFTNLQNDVIKLVADDMDYFNKFVAHIRNGIDPITIKSEFIVNDRPSAGFLERSYNKQFYNTVENKYKIEAIPESDLFNDETIKASATLKQNRAIFEKAGWNLSLHEINIEVPANITFDEYELNSLITANNEQMVDFAKTATELSEMFDRFCYNSITQLNKSKSYKVMRETLLCFVEYYLGYGEYEARKLILEPSNKEKVIELINLSLEGYYLWQKEKENEYRRLEIGEWTLPKERSYTDNNEGITTVKYHVLLPYYQAKNVSDPEKIFTAYIEQNSDYIEWWHKNGDSGKENFSVAYTNTANRLSLFYVDFIIQLKSGAIGLFDTKTKNSDPEAANKHNALLRYINEQEGDFVGGIIIPQIIDDTCIFRYSRSKIENTDNITGWEQLNFSVL